MRREYSIEFVEQGHDGDELGRVLGKETDLETATALFEFWAAQLPNRVVILFDRARVVARSDCR
jgi:hypothetical protein